MLLLPIILVLLKLLNAEQIGDSDVGNAVKSLTNYMLKSGVGYARYETQPRGIFGKLPCKAGDKSGFDGCMDVQGICRAHGAEYDRPNGKFKYRCNNGIEDTVACLGSKRANGKWINVGERLVVDGFWYACERQPSGSIVYAEEPSCVYYRDKRFHIDEEVKDFLKLKCTEDGFAFVGCYYKDQQGNEHNLQKGEKKVVSDAGITCEEGNSSIRFRPAPQTPSSTPTKFDRVFAHGVVVTNP